MDGEGEESGVDWLERQRWRRRGDGIHVTQAKVVAVRTCVAFVVVGRGERERERERGRERERERESKRQRDRKI